MSYTAATVPVLQLLGPAWTRSFRCVWMLEELREGTTRDSPPFHYQLLEAPPTSRVARTYNSTGKVPILLVHYNPIYAPRSTPSAPWTLPNRSTPSKTLDPTWYASNPLHATPDVEITSQPDLILSESSAINTFLADHFGTTTRLVPPVTSSRDTRGHDRAVYDMLVSCLTAELDAQGLWIHRKHDSMAEHFGRIPKAVAHAKQHFARLNAHVCATFLQPPVPANETHTIATTNDPTTHARYLMGRDFTAADIIYVHCLDWSRAIGWDSTWTDSYMAPHLHAYLEQCHERPAYQRAVQLRDHKRSKGTKANAESTSKL